MNNQQPAASGQAPPLDVHRLLDMLPDPLAGAPPSWIPPALPAAKRTLLAKALPDGPRGAIPALRALAQLLDRLGGDGSEAVALIEPLSGTPAAAWEPTAINQPLSYFICHAVMLGPSLDSWLLWALPALWEARRATSVALNAEQPLRLTPRVYQRAHAVLLVLRGLARLEPVSPAAAQTLEASIARALAQYTPAELGSKASADAALRAVRIFRGAKPLMPAPLAALPPVTLAEIRAGAPAAKWTPAPTRQLTPAHVDHRRDHSGALTTAAILGQDDLVRMSSALATMLLADAIARARTKASGAVQTAQALLWLLLTGQPPQRALASHPCALAVDDMTAAQDWLTGACLHRGIRWHPRLADVSAAGRAALRRAGFTPEEVAAVSGVWPTRLVVPLRHYVQLQLSASEAHGRLLRHAASVEAHTNAALQQLRQPPVEVDRVIALSAYLAWAKTHETAAPQPDAGDLQALGNALSLGVTVAAKAGDPVLQDRANGAVALYVCLAVLGLRDDEEIPFVQPSWFDAVRQRLVLPLAKAYPEGRAIPYTHGLQALLDGWIVSRRRRAPSGYLFSPSHQPTVRPRAGDLYRNMIAWAGQHGYAGPACDRGLFRHAALTALLELGRERRLGWIMKACIEGHSAWLQSDVCDLAWDDVASLFEPFWQRRLAEVGLAEARPGVRWA